MTPGSLTLRDSRADFVRPRARVAYPTGVHALEFTARPFSRTAPSPLAACAFPQNCAHASIRSKDQLS
jgi:hypothetical protein